jgi:hypothetical protein
MLFQLLHVISVGEICKKDMGLCVSFQVNLGIYVEDGSKELSVLVDRSIGGSSIKDGQIELMLHRSIQQNRIIVKI